MVPGSLCSSATLAAVRISLITMSVFRSASYHVAHGRMRCRRRHRSEIGELDQMGWRILTDHAHALREVIDAVENLLGELIEHEAQVAKERAVRLPMVVLVIGVEHEGVGNLAPKTLDDRAFE